MSERKKAPHLAPVENTPAKGPERRPRPLEDRKASIQELERYATALRIDCVRMLAVAKSGKTECEKAPAMLFVQVPGQLGRMGRALGLSGGHLLAASARVTGVAIARLRRWLTGGLRFKEV